MYEMQIRNKRGEPRWWMISGAPNYDEKGNLIAYFPSKVKPMDAEITSKL